MSKYTQELSQFKVCIRCGESKPMDEYHRDRSKADGHCSNCKACACEASRAWYEANRERVSEITRAWRAANPERRAEMRRAWEKANPEKLRAKAARQRARYPERRAARDAVNNAVKRGGFPAANTMVCDYCQEAQAQEWHHRNGYDEEHWLDVIAVCRPCHKKLDKAQVSQ